jgi:hypothetical protein
VAKRSNRLQELQVARSCSKLRRHLTHVTRASPVHHPSTRTKRVPRSNFISTPLSGSASTQLQAHSHSRHAVLGLETAVERLVRSLTRACMNPCLNDGNSGGAMCGTGSPMPSGDSNEVFCDNGVTHSADVVFSHQRDRCGTQLFQHQQARHVAILRSCVRQVRCPRAGIVRDVRAERGHRKQAMKFVVTRCVHIEGSFFHAHAARKLSF